MFVCAPFVVTGCSVDAVDQLIFSRDERADETLADTTDEAALRLRFGGRLPSGRKRVRYAPAADAQAHG
jgi:hypothetical protein